LEECLISKRSLREKASKKPKLAFIYHCDDFIKEIQADFSEDHDVKVFYRKERIRPWNIPFIKSKLRKIMRWADVCYFDWAAHPLEIASHMRKPKNTRIITRLHKFELTSWAPKINWKLVDMVIFVSSAIRDRFKESYPSVDATVIHNFVPMDHFSPSKKQFDNITNIISIVGNIIPEKRIYDIILAIKKIRNQVPVRLFIVGDDSTTHAQHLRAAVKYLGLEDCVIFKGYHKNIKLIYQASDIVVCNSLSESFSYVLQEAALSGCYTLTHDWLGSEEFYTDDMRYTHTDEFIEKVLNYYNLSSSKRSQKLKSLVDYNTSKIHKRNQLVIQNTRNLI